VHFRYKLAKGAVNAIFNFDEAFRDYKNAFPADPYKGRSKTIDVYGNFDLSEMFQLLAGVDYRHQKSIDENATPKNPTMNMVSPYASLHLRNAGGFFMEVGTRYNHHSKFGSHTTFSVNPGYTLNSNVKVFANISSAFKAPALSSLYGQWGANPDLKPERSSTFEGGVQASLFANRFNFRAVGFARNTKDVIIYGPSFTMINLDDQKDHGFEIEPTVKFNEKIRLALHYAYVNGEVHTVKEGKDTSYANLIRKPKHSTGFTGSYQITPRLFFSTSVFTYSSRTDVDFNSFPSEEVTMKGYAVWNAFAEYGLFSNKLKLFFDVKNITNTKYEEVWGYSALGVNFMGGLSVKF
ncbi:MAG TPA: TonB-dependent receptor, partial [Parasegetibacter sp.]